VVAEDIPKLSNVISAFLGCDQRLAMFAELPFLFLKISDAEKFIAAITQPIPERAFNLCAHTRGDRLKEKSAKQEEETTKGPLTD